VSGATSTHMRLYLSHPVDGDPTSWTGFTTPQLGAGQHFKITRPGVQRLSSTDMQEDIDGALYYADVELISLGPGNEFNIDPDLQLDIVDHKSDGYILTNEDENFAFSTYEQLRLQISRRVLTPGSTDTVESQTLISQQNLQVNYDRSPLVDQLQSYILSDLDRVLNANLVAKHLVPHFVQFEVVYQEGSLVVVVEEDIENYINGLLPDEVLEASAIGEIPRKRGASRVEMPITLLGVVHQVDRVVRIDRSQDFISRGRLATFLPDELTVTRET
jgi:hypothetical protein